MVWGCFAGSTVGDLIAYPKGGIGTKEYINTMEQGLLPFILKLNSDGIDYDDDVIRVATMGDYIYMHDNALIHRARVTEAFLAQNHITTMDWPANSPDLNPIEHLWHHMKMKFHAEFFNARHTIPSRSHDALEIYMNGLMWVWKTQLGDLPQRLVASMPGRVAAVISARGGHTHY